MTTIKIPLTGRQLTTVIEQFDSVTSEERLTSVQLDTTRVDEVSFFGKQLIDGCIRIIFEVPDRAEEGIDADEVEAHKKYANGIVESEIKSIEESQRRRNES